MPKLLKGSEHRQADHPIESIFIDRWSPRAMSGESISQSEMNSLFEAARWAPSSYNEQPWHFLYAHRDGKFWDTFLDLLVPGNRDWCVNAGVLMVVVGRKLHAYNSKPNKTYAFDTGAAWVSLALQASRQGLVTHGMVGFDADKAKSVLNVPDTHEVIAMVAVGHPGDPLDLPEATRKNEKPNGRKKIEEFVKEGGF